VKQSADPIPSAKAASADALISSVAIKVFRYLPAILHCPEANHRFDQNTLIICAFFARDNYIYFFLFYCLLENRFARVTPFFVVNDLLLLITPSPGGISSSAEH
jgi:hypothetical protein